MLAWQGDVSSESSVNALLTEVTARFGRCDILVNCAGIFPSQPFAEMTFTDWRRVQAVNLDSVFLMCAAFVPGNYSRTPMNRLITRLTKIAPSVSRK